MDTRHLKRLSETLSDLRVCYDDARTIVREMRARECANTEQAYWVGVAQSFSKTIADDMMTLHDAIDRLEAMARSQR